MSDKLTLAGMQFHGHHGTEVWEKETGRRFEVDVELHRDMTRPGRTDDLHQAMDYRRIYALTKSVVEGESHDLIERIAWRLVEVMFAAYPKLDAVTVRVIKPEAPIGGINRGAIVEIHRTRAQWIG
jgi:dihydroneopterin aldolase